MRAIAPGIEESMLEHALYWAGQGWKVFPLCTPLMGSHVHKRDGDVCDESSKDYGKAPMVGGGFKTGTQDPTQIRTWWTRWPTANIGATPPDKHVVVDIDGETDVQFATTRMHSTSKGTHLLYRDPEGRVPQGNRVWPNIDTRVSGKGYVVLPPSLHASGTRYSIGDSRAVSIFPYDLLPATAVKSGGKGSKGNGTDLASLLAKAQDDPSTGDDWLAQVAGHLAHIARSESEFVALVDRINASLVDPLSSTAVAKKHGIWQAEMSKPERTTDEERGWLIETSDSVGYCTTIGGGDSLEVVTWSDFRVQAKGLIIHPDNQTWIIDFHRSDGSILENVRVDASILSSTSRLLDFLMRRGMSIFPHSADKRGSHGARLLKMLQSQKAPVLYSRDFYGWCEETQAFLIDVGEIDKDGLRSFTEMYPLDELVKSCPVAYGFEHDMDQVRDHMRRIMALQDETETAKIMSWLMMLMLREQWQGLLPGLLVEAFAGTGKTTFFKLLSSMAGVPQDGENMTAPTARDMLAGHSSGFIWLDDVKTDPRMEELVRKAITQGREVLKSNATGTWITDHKHLKGSVIISGEGVDFYRQKAYRDRFISAEFKRNPTSDAEALVRANVGRGAGTLLAEVMRYADLLPTLEEDMRSGVTSRDEQARATLRIGSRILDAVLGSEGIYSGLVDAWCSGKAQADDLGQASECVLHVFPSLWVDLNYPESAGHDGLILPLYLDPVSRTFFINGKRCAEAWNNRRNVTDRQKQLTSPANIKRELDACEATASKSKRTGLTGTGSVIDYRELPARYSAMVLQAATETQQPDES